MSTTLVPRRAIERTDTPPRDREADTSPYLPQPAMRAERTDARWTVRVVLEADRATTAIRSVRAIIFDRDLGAGVLHTVWSDWHDVPYLVTHLPAGPLTAAALETAASGLAEALLALLGHDAATCLAALHAGDVPPLAPGMGRRARQYRRIVRDVGWQDPWANRGPDRGGTAERTDMSEAETAQWTLTGWVSGQADRVRGDS